MFIYSNHSGDDAGATEASNSGGLARLPVSAQELVGRSPFLADDGIAYVGSKHTDLFVIDAASGTLDTRLSSSATHEAPWPLPRKADGRGALGRVMIGRQEYTVRAVDSATGALTWNASIASFSVQRPGPADPHLCRGARARRRGGRMVTTAGGAVHAIEAGSGERLWTAHLAAPAVAAFGVALGPGDGGARPVCDVWETEVRAPRPHARVPAGMNSAGPVPDRGAPRPCVRAMRLTGVAVRGQREATAIDSDY